MFKELKSGVFFSSIGQFSSLFVQFFLSIVLSRMLTPKEFGVIAVVQVFLIFFQMMVTSGFGPAIIQSKILSERDYSIIFNFTIILGIISSILFGCLGFLIAKLYHNQIYIPVAWIMSGVIMTEAMNTVPSAILNKNKQFRLLNIRLVVANSFGAAFSVIAAFLGLGVYSIVISVMVPSFISLIFNIINSKIKFIFAMEKSSFDKVWDFTKNQFAAGIVTYFSRNSDGLIVGKCLGPTALGFYSKAYTLIMLPNAVFMGMVQPVLQPIFSAHQDNIEIIRTSYLKILRVLFLFSAPITIYFVLNADQLIFFLFGNQWHRAHLPVVILGTTIWVQMTYSTIGPIFLARNQSREQFLQVAISAIVMVVAIVVGVLFGNITYVAIFVALGYIINFFVAFWLLFHRSLDSNLIPLFKQMVSPLCLAVVVASVSFFTLDVTDYKSAFLTLLVRGIILVIASSIYFVIAGEYKKLKMLV